MQSSFPPAPLYALPTHSAPVNALVFSTPSSNAIPYILTGSSDRTIHLSNPNRGLPVTNPPADPPTQSGSSATTSTPRNRNNEKNASLPPGLVHSYEGHAYPVLDLAVSADNSCFISGGGDKLVFLWDVETGQTRRRFGGGFGAANGHTGRIECVQLAGDPEGSVVVSGSQDTTVMIWDVKSHSAKPIQVLDEAKDTVSAISVRGHEIISGSTDGRVRRYDLRMGQITTDVVGWPVTSLRRTRDGQALLVSVLNSRILLLDVSTGSVLKTYCGREKADGGEASEFKNEELRLRSTFAANEGVVVCGSESGKDEDRAKRSIGEIFAWNVLSGEVIAKLKHGETMGKNGVVGVVAWTDRRGRVGTGWWASGGSDGVVKIWGEKG